jgi:hypothetical protein
MPLNPLLLPDTSNEPVITALPLNGKAFPSPLPVLTVIGKVDPSPLVKVIVFKDTDAVVSNDPVLTAAAAFKA